MTDQPEPKNDGLGSAPEPLCGHPDYLACLDITRCSNGCVRCAGPPPQRKPGGMPTRDMALAFLCAAAVLGFAAAAGLAAALLAGWFWLGFWVGFIVGLTGVVAWTARANIKDQNALDALDETERRP